MRVRKGTVGIALIGILASACARTVEYPRDDFETASRDDRPRIVMMTDGSQYIVQKFSLTDSTLVVEDLSSTDSRFKQVDWPIPVPFTEVPSIKKREPRCELVVYAALFTGTVIYNLNSNPISIPQ